MPTTVWTAIVLAMVGTASLAVVGLPPASAAAGPQPSSSLASTYRAVVARYCVACHNDRLRTANLQLDTIDIEHVGVDPEVWEKVVRKLRARSMPPPGRPRPDEATYDGLASWLETALDRAAAVPPPGRAAIHRLNRSEYTNAVRDLLALEINGRALLPEDNLAYGFDNNADLLTVTPGLLERYLSAARKISRLAIGDPTLSPVVETYKVSSLLEQDDRMSQDLPFGTRGGIAIRHHFPLDGKYVFRVRLRRDGVGNIPGLFEPQQVEVRLDGTRVALFTVEPNDLLGSDWVEELATADAGFDIRVPVQAGTRLVGVALLNRTWAVDGVGPTRLPVGELYLVEHSGYARTLGVGSVEIDGPYAPVGSGDTPSRRQILVCRPTSPQDDEPCARQILSTLARRAYRRPVTDADRETLLGFYRTARREGEAFETGIQWALEQILVHPEFLFRIEPVPPGVGSGTAYRIGDLALASRLSFFLWASVPDDELLDVAAHGRLHEPAVLEQQVRRMLADRRATTLVDQFAVQWLHQRNMLAVAPDVKAFPEFDDNLRAAFQRETRLFLQSQLREDRSVFDLLRADYTFVNERVARHYGIPNVYGSHFRRVTVTDEARKGLLGHGSILTVTSYATRTSPVVRGKWLLENILDAPPPPPPPDVPSLPDRDADAQPTSVRKRLEQHRSNPVCASCHAQMDPLGFALENFDAVGRWRTTTEANTPIDASGTLPDGTTFDGPVELREVLLARPEEFARTVASKLLTYALGRGIEYYDMPAIRQILREAALSDYRWSSIILGIVKSQPFQMGRSAS